MADSPEPSFGWLVVTRAWQSTLETFETTTRAIILALAAILVSLAIQFFRHGIAGMTADLWTTVWQTVLPVLAVGLCVLLWNLWLAPAALSYQVAKTALAATTVDATAAHPMPDINWAPWKDRSYYTLLEFAKILSKTNPAAPGLSTDGSSYLRLLKEQIAEKKLPYKPRLAVGFDGKGYPMKTDADTEISRQDAIDWAKEKRYVIDHIL